MSELKNVDLQHFIAVTLEEVKIEMCDKYCKYTETWDEEKEGIELYRSEICENCPLGRL